MSDAMAPGRCAIKLGSRSFAEAGVSRKMRGALGGAGGGVGKFAAGGAGGGATGAVGAIGARAAAGITGGGGDVSLAAALGAGTLPGAVTARANGLWRRGFQPRHLVLQAADLRHEHAFAFSPAHQRVEHDQGDVDRQRGDKRRPEAYLELQICADEEGARDQGDGALHDEIGNTALSRHPVLAVFNARHGRVTMPPCQFVISSSFSRDAPAAQ